VRSIKRTAEVIPGERLAAEEERSSSGSSEVISEGVRGVPLQRQDDWVDLLPMAEFQYNNHIHSSTQQTPFFLDSGQHLRMGFEPQQLSRLESVNEFTDRMKLALEEAKSALAKAKNDMAQYYNQRRLPTPVYKPVT
jgi:hypothetical protein